MVRISSKRLFTVLLLCTLLVFTCAAFAAKDEGYSSADLKKMSAFLSNFTELGFMSFDAKELTNEDDPADMIRFAIQHNDVHNYKSRIAQCKKKNCEWGSLVIEGKYVTETIKKFFDVDYKKLASVPESDPPYFFDGKLYHFDGADGEPAYYARVDEAEKNSEGQIVMRGVIYNAEDESDLLGSFEALAKPHKFGGKDTWAILSMETERYDNEGQTSDDDAVEGLWIEVSKFPEEADPVAFDMNDEGVASFTRILKGGAVVLVVERLPVSNADGEPLTPENLGKLVADYEGIAEDEITITPSLDALAELYSYPVAGAEFTTGEGEDARNNIDVFLFTDPWLFRIHVSVAAVFMEEYEEQIQEWLTNLKFRE